MKTPKDIAEVSTRRSRRRWPWIVLGLFALLLLLAGLAPRIASIGTVRKALLVRINAKIAPATLAVDDWSLRWFGPLAVSGLHFADPGQGVDARIARLGVSNSLAAMLRKGKLNLGTITVSEPHVSMRLPEKPPKAAPANPSPSAQPATGVKQPAAPPLSDLSVKLVVQDGRIEIAGTGTPAFVLEQLGLTAEIKSLRDPVSFAFTTAVPCDGESGKVALEGTLPGPEYIMTGATTTTDRLTLELSKLNLRSLRPLLESLTGQSWIRSGLANGKVALDYRGKSSLQLKTDLTVAGLSVEPPGKPVSPPGDVRVQAELSFADGRLTISQFSCASPWLGAQASGQFAVAPDANGRHTGGIEAKLEADLVALTRDFGSLLKLNGDLQVEGGKARMDLSLAGTTESVEAKVSLATDDLAVRADKQLFLPRPSPSMKLHLFWPYAQAPEVRELLVDLPFARLTGKGHLDDASLQANINLSEFSKTFRSLTTNCPDMRGTIDLDLNSHRDGERMAASLKVKASEVTAEMQTGRRLDIGSGQMTASAKVPMVNGRPVPELSDLLFAIENAAGSISGAVARFVPASSNRPPLISGGQLKIAVDLEAARSFAAPFLTNLPPDAVLSGKAQMEASLEGTDESLDARVNLTTESLALRSGRAVLAMQPSPALKLNLFWPYAKSPEIRELQLDLPFARIGGKGRLDDATLKANVDLAAFSRDFRRVLTNCPAMTGTIDMELTSHKDGDRMAAALLVTIANLTAELRPGQRLTLDSGRLTASAKALLVKGMPAPGLSDLAFAFESEAGSISGAADRLVPPAGNIPPLIAGGRIKAALDLEKTRDFAAPFLTNLPPDSVLKGKLTLDAQCTTDLQGGTVSLNAALDQFSFAKPANQPFLEPHAELAVKAAFSAEASRLTLDTLSLKTSLAEINARGRIDDFQKQRLTDLSGTLMVDFDKLNLLLRANGAANATIAGRQARPFVFKGPLGDNPRTLLAQTRAEAALYLASAAGFGLAAGPSDIGMQLSNGVLRLSYAPTLNQGTLQLTPSIEATADPMVFSLPPGARVLQNAQLTQDMLDQVLVMVLPLLRGSSVLGGSVDLTMLNCRVPLGDTLKRDTTFSALLTLRNVRLAPSGILGTVFQMAGLGGKEVTIQQHELTAVCKDGRITPSPLDLNIAGNTVKLTGSVGLDGTLAYTAEVPMAKNLVGKEAEKYLEGVTIKVPIAGTVKSPTINRSAMNSEIKRLIEEALKKAAVAKMGDLLKNIKF